MAITQTTYTGNGSTTNYSFTFEYLKQADVKVTLDTVATTAFTFANATTLAFTTAPASGVAIRIFRDTAIDNLSATFFPGSAIKAEDLNENFTQNLYVTQESDFEVDTANTTANTAKTTADTALTNSTTAISTANSATTTANTAITTSNSATTTANAATTTANTASTNASSAVTTANTASTNATAAVNTANTASTNASAAVTTANSAQADATTAISTANSATATANSATTTANSAVTTANTANTNATAAQTAATNAQASATAAQTSATAAQTSATAAQAQATLAADVRNAFTVTDSNSDGTFDFVVGDIPIKGNAGVKLPFESVTYAEEGAIRYNNSLDKIELYNGAGQWVTAGGGASVSSTPPTLPSAGDVWYDHDNGRAYVYYNDGDSNQWVEMNPSWNGYVADNSVTSAKIVDGTIVNADVNASAAIALSKLATGALPSAITVASSNIVDGTIVNADVNASAAIAQSKLALDITNSEVNASAAIAGTKISPNFGSQNVLTTGSVGIGTTSPESNAQATIYEDSGNTPLYLKANNTNSFLYLEDSGTASFKVAVGSSNNNLKFITDGSERLRIASSGNVGIGTSNPNGLLTVQADSGRLITFRNSTTGTGSGDGSYITLSGSDLQISNGESANTIFYTSDTERLRIDSSGRVGIGISNPDAYYQHGRSLVVGATGANSGITIRTGNANQGILAFADGVSGGTQQYAGYVIYDHSNDNMLFATGAATRMRIDSAGNVGIGTTPNSDSQLHVKSGANDNNPILRLEAATSNFLNFRQTGSVYDIHVTANDPLSFSIGASERARILPSGGLTFNGDTAAANALDDYEEGTWTPRLGGTTGGNYTPGTSNHGWYRKVGSIVYYGGTLHWIAQVTAASGAIYISGLPYTATSTADARSPGRLGGMGAGSLTFTSGFSQWALIIDPTATFAYIIQLGSSGSSFSHHPTIASSGIVYGFGGMYITA